MDDNEFAKSEFHENYQMFRHYHNIQYSILKYYLTISTAIWGSFFYLNKSCKELSVNFLLIIGMTVGLLILITLLTNRYYFLIFLQKLEFIKKYFLFKDDDLWKKYPGVYPEKDNGNAAREKIKMTPVISTFMLTLSIIIIGNTLLFYKIEFCIGDIKFCCSTIVFLIQFLMILVISQYYQNKLNRNKY